MKICYIASPGIHTSRWLKYFVDKGHEVHQITTVKPSDGGVDGVRWHLLKRFGPRMRVVNYLINTVPLLFQFKRLIRNINPDIIHAHQIMDSTLLGAVSGFRPFVVTPFGSDVLVAPKTSKVSRWMVKYVLERADLIASDADHIKKPLTKLGADPQKFQLICFGVDTQEFKPGQRDERFREKLGILNSPTIISLRRLEPIGDVESLITAVPLVLKEVPEAKFLLVQRGSQEAKLKQLAKSLGVSDSVKFTGLVPVNEIPRYLASADICVSTSLSDAGLGASTAEAMACGLPVVITDFGDNRKWVQDGVNGFIIPMRAPEILASKIIHLLKDKETRKRFGEINRKIIVERNDREKEMGKMAKLYEELIEKYKSEAVF